MSHEAKDLLNKLLDKNPVTRINAKDALRHQWFDDCKNDQDENIFVLSPETAHETDFDEDCAFEKYL